MQFFTAAIVTSVYNKTLQPGACVKMIGYSYDRPNVTLANPLEDVIGIVGGSIRPNETQEIGVLGIITGINTNNWPSGTFLYCGADGYLTHLESGPHLAIVIQQSSNGIIYANCVVPPTSPSTSSGTTNGIFQSTYLDPNSIVLPPTIPYSPDGSPIASGDYVLFTGLSFGNNRVYKASILGLNINWVMQAAFDGSTAPTDGSAIWIQKGVSEDSLIFWTGTEWKDYSSDAANKFLSNLSATQANQSLVPQANNILDIGSLVKNWANLHARTLKSNDSLSIESVNALLMKSALGMSLESTALLQLKSGLTTTLGVDNDRIKLNAQNNIDPVTGQVTDFYYNTKKKAFKYYDGTDWRLVGDASRPHIVTARSTDLSLTLGSVVVDGVSINPDDEVLFDSLTTLSDRGVWKAVGIIGNISSWTRVIHGQSPSGLSTQGDIVLVSQGYYNNSSYYYCTNTSGAKWTRESVSNNIFSIQNNQIAPIAIVGLAFDAAKMRSLKVEFSVQRTTSTTELLEKGMIVIGKRPSGMWLIDRISNLDDSEIEFTIDANGQIFYTTSNMGGSSYIGDIKWKILSENPI